MRLKEIKPGMVIHCKNISEYERLEEETIKNGYDYAWSMMASLSRCMR